MAIVEQLNGALTGRYMIEREIGRGGMATVYLAHDLRHDRAVALKVLLAELGALLGPDRFLSEIRVTANLQHPNLLPLFDSGEVDGRLFYVMPYVEGESLRHRLDREKQLPVDDAIRIATACASALAYAHKRDVIHRDLKPENILLSAGQPVIADFGIARAVSSAGGARITQTGLSLGTPQYMSPEQAAGDRDVDQRSDIYSLGCVLYEMLTGEPPLTGSTVQAVIARVLVEKPRSARAQRDTIPAHVDAAIERALAKLPADRWPTADDFSAALTDPRFTASMTTRSAAAEMARSRSDATGIRRLHRLVWPALAIIFMVVAGALSWRARSAPPPQAVSFVVPTPETAKLAVDPSFVSFAPDGSSIVYVASVAGGRKLYSRRLDEIAAREIPGTDDAFAPFFSPDGRWVAYGTSSGVIYRVPVRGGAPIQIARTTGFRGGAWSSNGAIVISSDSGIYRIASGEGRLELLTRPDAAKGEMMHALPMFLPDGKSFLFRIDDSFSRANNRLAVASLDRNGHEVLGIAGGNPLAVIDGRLFFGAVGGRIVSVPFDLRQKKPTGDPVELLSDVSVFAGAAASFAGDGSLVYVKSANNTRIVISDLSGAPFRAGAEGRRYFFPRFSPDGRRIAVQISSAVSNLSDIWTYDLESHALSRVTSTATAARPEWTPDGNFIVYLSLRGGKWEAWRIRADGSGAEEKYFAQPHSLGGVVFSPAGGLAVASVISPATNADVWVLATGSSGEVRDARPLLATRFNETQPRVSRDGRWLAYASDESGRYEVYVRPFPGSGPRVQVSVNGGSEPVWSNGRLIYRAGDKFLAATLNGIAVTGREELFEGQYSSSFTHASHDVDVTGKRLVLLQPIGTPEIVVMLNALDKLVAEASVDR